MGYPRVLEEELTGTLSKDNRHRLERVMRLREGDKFIITNGSGNEAEAVLMGQGEYKAGAWVDPGRESGYNLTLFAGISKGEKFDWMVEKAVELGARAIVPVISQHCVVKKPSEAKIDRWQKIALSAMLQCGGCILPKVHEPIAIEKIAAPDSSTRAIVLYEEQTDALGNSGADDQKTIWLLTGSEGGFSRTEVERLVDQGWQVQWLGRRIFRAETAPLVAISMLLYGKLGNH